MPRIGSFLIHEAKRAFPPTLFFLIVFHLAVIIRHLDDIGFGITATRSGSASVAALILGKIYLLMDEQSFANRFKNRPLILGTLWKTVIYWSIATIATTLEELLPAWFHLGDFDAAVTEISKHFKGAIFIANHLILFVSIFIFSALSELTRAIGGRKVWILFFGTRFLKDPL